MEGKQIIIVLRCEVCDNEEEECSCDEYKISPASPDEGCEECGMLYGCTCDYEDLSEEEEDEEKELVLGYDEDIRILMFYDGGDKSRPLPKYVAKNGCWIKGFPKSNGQKLVDATHIADELEVSFLLALVGGGEDDTLYVSKCGKVKYDSSKEWVLVSSLNAKTESRYPNNSAAKNQPKLKEEVYGDALLVQFDGQHFYSFPPVHDLEGYKRQFFTSKTY